MALEFNVRLRGAIRFASDPGTRRPSWTTTIPKPLYGAVGELERVDGECKIDGQNLPVVRPIEDRDLISDELSQSAAK